MITKIPIKGTNILDIHPASTIFMRIKFKNKKVGLSNMVTLY
jgi:hypothetical protein